MSDSDRLRRLTLALYEFRDYGTYRDMPDKDGNRKMNATAYRKLLQTFNEIEREQGIDATMMTAQRRSGEPT